MDKISTDSKRGYGEKGNKKEKTSAWLQRLVELELHNDEKKSEKNIFEMKKRESSEGKIYERENCLGNG